MTGTAPESARWRKSPASGPDDCVEVAYPAPGVVLVRSSKDRDGAVLQFTTSEWEAFLTGVRAGTFDVEPG